MSQLSRSALLSTQDMEDFAQDYLGLTGVDADMYYESYYQLNTDDEYDEDCVREDEVNQTKWQY